VAYAQAQTYSFNIPAQDLASALKVFGHQAHQQIAFDGAIVRGKMSAAVKGNYTPDEALNRLLAQTGLHSGRTASGVLLVKGEPAGPPVEAVPAATEPALEQ